MSVPIPWAELAHRARAGRLRALSIRQPWPHHIFNDGKDVENRDWPTRFRGWVLVHAGVNKSEDPALIRKLALPLGGYVGVMLITDCVERLGSRWFFGRYGFVIGAAAPMPLVTGRGALGFFTPDRDVLPAIEASLLSRVAG